MTRWIFFVSQAQMQLRQVNENQNSFEINLESDTMVHPERSWWVRMRSEVNSRACVTFSDRNEYAWCQRLGYEVRGQYAIEGHTCSRIDLWPHTHSLWPHSMTSYPQINFKLFGFSLTWSNCIFAWLTKITTASLLIVTHHWFFNWQKTSRWFI